MKVFCIGTWKTGTTSMGSAINTLMGGSHINWKNGKEATKLYLNNKNKEVLKISKEYNTFDDSPWNCYGIWQLLIDEYKDAKFILNIRDEESWFNSMCKWYNNDLSSRKEFDLISLYHLQLNPYNFNVNKMKYLNNHKGDWIKWYRIRNEHIIKTIPKERLLVMNINNGWDPLCEFLDKPLPSFEFPILNINTKK